jgi:hypothetical protein
MEAAMPAIQNTLLGLVVVAALAAPAYTQQSPSSPYGLPKSYDGVTLYYPDTGRTVAGKLNDGDMKMAMQHAKPMSGPVMVVISGGQAFIVDDMSGMAPDGTTSMPAYFDQGTMRKQ